MASCPGSSPLTRGKPTSARPASLSPRLIPAHAGKTDGGIQTAVARKAHPRSRGENAGAGAGIAAMSGSSPLTRGKPSRSQRNAGQIRLIPAHAGKTSPGQGRPRWCAAHPRSRGENWMTYNVAQWVRGSSPLTRGKPRLLEILLHGTRLIPAHAGKTRPEHPRTARTGAHPRSRGENGPAAGMVPRVVGSSPLTRGKQTNAALAGPPGRLIPAHAGKTWSYVTGPDNLWAHPRSRGENAFRRRKRQHTRGSSPLTRGKRPRAQPLHASQRLIPAHAGKTPRRHRVAASLPAHPRSRGENGRCSLSFSLLRGSSPLTRGKLPRELVDVLSEGLIPAHAGKTVCDRACKHHGPAHPRSRGENLVSAVQVGNAGGSSPLTRGKRAGHGRGPGPEGLIPAHAGKTGCRLARGIGARAHPRSRGEN